MRKITYLWLKVATLLGESAVAIANWGPSPASALVCFGEVLGLWVCDKKML
ncbi:MAG: hypothetical protein LBJ38_03875 [Oscillospiraceae bacterium]|jgi:hypothetical protein|nr:hypothetical protein [Oscillospiraceae bacterium]